MNRKALQDLAETRLADAQTLFQNRRFDGAYYLAGYVIECALKACIAKRTKRHDFPEKRFVSDVHTHNLFDLHKLAGLEQRFEEELRQDPDLGAKWGLVKDWNESSRYQAHGRRKAKEMLTAVADLQGVFACIKRYW